MIMLSLPVQFPFVFASGIFVSLEQMPFRGFVLSYNFPLTCFTHLVRNSFASEYFFLIWNDIALLGMFTIVFTAGTTYLNRMAML